MTKNTRGFQHIRVGYAGSHLLQTKSQSKRDASASCYTGGFYTSPTNGQSISASTGSKLDIAWDTSLSCLSPTSGNVDIYLYAPSNGKSLIHQWENVPYSPGSYAADLEPKWWNSTSSMGLQLAIVESGTPVAMNPLPAGPVFTATYSGTTAEGGIADSTDSGITDVNALNKHHGLSKGKIAAAALVPILFIIGLVAAAYIRISRQKGKEDRKRWSQAVDKRMSTISTDWKSISAAGANAAIRNSIVGSGNRASSFSFGAIRPSSEYSGPGTAGIGARGVGMYTQDSSDPFSPTPPPMAQLRHQRLASANSGGERVSRVSFADAPRPSMDRKSVASRAYHTGFVPPMPTRKDSTGSTASAVEEMMSPTQTTGALDLQEEDISKGVEKVGETYDVMPALTMMRTGVAHTEFDADAEENEDDYIIPRAPKTPPSAPAPELPPPTHQPTSSPMGMPMPASVMSPDEMLRAYATRRVTSPPGTPSAQYSSLPAVSYNGGGMRTLYSPATPMTPGTAAPLVNPHGEDDDGAYAGMH